MHGYLGQHPQVYMSPRKEPLFFAPDLPGLPGDRIGDPYAYLALFKDATDQRRAGEASPVLPVLPARLGRDWPAVSRTPASSSCCEIPPT